MKKPGNPESSPLDKAESPPLVRDSEVHIFESNLNYAGFLEQLRQEGLKGKIKRVIFNGIGFFACWQGKINNALYEAFAKQEAQILKQEAQISKQEAQISKQEAQIANWFRIIEDFKRRLSELSLLEDALYQELTELKAQVAKQRRLMNQETDS